MLMVLVVKGAPHCSIVRRNCQFKQYGDGIGGERCSILWHRLHKQLILHKCDGIDGEMCSKFWHFKEKPLAHRTWCWCWCWKMLHAVLSLEETIKFAFSRFRILPWFSARCNPCCVGTKNLSGDSRSCRQMQMMACSQANFLAAKNRCVSYWSPFQNCK